MGFTFVVFLEQTKYFFFTEWNVDPSKQQQSSLNAIQLAELEASKLQLKEHQTQIAQLEGQIAAEKLTQQDLSLKLQSAGDQFNLINEKNRELNLNIEQLNAELVRLESMKNNEIAQVWVKNFLEIRKIISVFFESP